MSVQFFYFFVYMFEAVIAYIYFSDNYEKRQKNYISILISFGLYCVCFIVNYIDNNNFIINDIVTFLVNLIYCRISFHISMKSGIFHSSILLAIMYLTELLVEAGAASFLHIPLDAYKKSLTALILLGVICKALYFILCKLISTLFSYKKNKAVNDIKKNSALFLYPLITIAMLTVFMHTSIVYNFSKQLNFICVLLSIISLIFCIFIFIYNQRIQKQEYDLIKLQTESQKNEQDRTFYGLLEKKNEEQRILVHDINHHYSALMSMDNIEDMKKYLTKVQPELDEYKFIGKTQNKMLDFILNKYSHICQTNDIDFRADARTSNLDFMEDTDLSSMLGNLLDNAVEAARGSENPFIRFAARKDKNFDIVSVVNSSSHSPKARGETLITTKSNSAFHGYGIKSIERTAEKYDGVCQWNYDEENKEFHFNILFNKIK